ncbi:MAG: hypothetical protein GX564_07665 [Oligosphaeraceae bacterium]|nr:hypothetical protein [Oligosphaeraceae bacterium]
MIIFVFFFHLYSLTLPAAPSINAVSLVQGTSMVRNLQSTVTLTWTILNPDPTTAELTLQLEPEGSHGGAIYTQQITLGPKSSLSGRSPVVISDSERYLVSLIQDNVRIDKSDILLREGQRNRLQIALVTDYDDIAGYSNIAKDDGLARRISFHNFRQAGVPEHYSGFRDFSLLLLLRPKLASYKFSQIQAILDYVQRGGCVVIGDAETALSLQDTPLAALLPYQPVAKKYFHGFNSARKALQLPPQNHPLRDANGDLIPPRQQEFLEVLTPDHSRVLLQQDGRPAVCLQRVGLGSSLGLCFDPFFLSHYDQDCRIPLWDIIIRYSNYRPENHRPDATRAVNTTLQHLQGYSIPPISAVMQIFWLYVLSGAFILIVLFHFRRPALAWGVLCLSSVVFTAIIFIKARNVAAGQPERSFTAVTAGLWQGSDAVRWGTGNFFSLADCRPTVKADILQTFFSPQELSASHEGGTALAPSPLRLTYTRDLLSLERMSLQQYRPRTLCWENISANYGQDSCPLPVLQFTGPGYDLQPCPLPEAKKNIQRAVLALPGAVKPLRVEHGVITGLSPDNGVEADVAFLSALDYIRALRLPHPTVCLITPRQEPSWNEFTIHDGESTFSGYDYHLDLLPVSCGELPETFTLPPEFCSLDIPNRSFLRQNYQYGKFTEVFLQENSNILMPIDFELYPLADYSRCKRISIELDISNPSGKAIFELELQDLSGKALPPASRNGNTLVFETADLPVVSPQLNKFRAHLRVSSTPGNPASAALSQRVNYWKILALNVTLHN